ncbi:hypothetical protein BpHYR1_029377 [Brachionus plicatilis]|uniref:Uncharacterized protein n=1 Tax=Brachionus plicatilis TaxID=10195 RepID=A0A3M7PAC7_BRAPC|nr:hypothetical protein BpHYR1_029377 [Brachionus plicatilis]
MTSLSSSARSSSPGAGSGPYTTGSAFNLSASSDRSTMSHVLIRSFVCFLSWLSCLVLRERERDDFPFLRMLPTN